MGISGAVIYGLIVMGIREIAVALRWAWRVYRDGVALYGASYYGIPHVTDQESKGMAAPYFQPAMRTDWPLKSIGLVLTQAQGVQPANPQSCALLPKAANDADRLREPVASATHARR